MINLSEFTEFKKKMKQKTIIHIKNSSIELKLLLSHIPNSDIYQCFEIEHF